MAKKPKSVLSGGYVTKETTDKDGNPKIIATIKATGPVMARLSELAAIAVTAAIGVGSLTGAIFIEDASWVQRGIMCAIPIPIYFASKFGFYHALSRKKNVVYTTAIISFYRFLRKHNFDLSMSGHWVIDDHPRAILEQRKRESKRANPDFKEPRFYIKAFHAPVFEDAAVLSYEYEGQRFPFMVFDTHRNAQKFQAHLTAVGSVSKGYKGFAHGTLTSPDDYWDNGDIIDHRRSAS